MPDFSEIDDLLDESLDNSLDEDIKNISKRGLIVKKIKDDLYRMRELLNLWDLATKENCLSCDLFIKILSQNIERIKYLRDN